MTFNNIKINRNYGYEILINTFEPFLRNFIINEVLIPEYSKEWKTGIPQGIFSFLEKRNEGVLEEEINIEDFFEELTFYHLKDIILFKNHFEKNSSLIGGMSKSVFEEMMLTLNRYRRRIAHPKSTFSNLELLNVKDCITLLCQGEAGKSIRLYLDNREYENARDLEIPLDFLEEYEYPNNLPPEFYNYDGGFVGRQTEIQAIMGLLKSQQDRIVTITGAGGVGKTAIALKIAYMFLESHERFYDTFAWFSAKETKLTDDGIVPIKPDITSYQKLVEDMLQLFDRERFSEYKEKKEELNSYKNYLYNFFENHQCLIIIDNLETIIGDEELITFIKNIPRPSQVLITSRKGLGEIERRYALKDLLEKDAIHLFKLVSLERNLKEIAELKDRTISKLVNSVRCYPLLIKWSLGQVCLGVEIEKAFSTITTGDSEIAVFSFNDVFQLLSDKSRHVLYSMVVAGDRPVSKYILQTLSNLSEDEFEDSIRELTLTSFIYTMHIEEEKRISIKYIMLELTRGFVRTKLDEEEAARIALYARFYDLSDQIADLERSQLSYSESLDSFGIKTIDDKAAFNYVKTAKNYEFKNDVHNAERNYTLAFETSPELPYVLIEYSKFKHGRHHHQEALELAKTAVDVSPDNFLAWLNYGIILSKTRNYEAAIESLDKAKKLYPDHLLPYRELGRLYTYIGEYAKAEEELEQALMDRGFPNYKHLVITLQFKADNYRRWAEKFRRRKDQKNRLEKLHSSRETIEKAVQLSIGDWRIWKVYRRVYVDLGVATCTLKGFSDGKPFLERSIAPIDSDRKLVHPDGIQLAIGNYYLALFSSKEQSIDSNIVLSYIKKGLRKCPKDSKWYNRLWKLRRKIEKDKEKKEEKDRLHGEIVYFNKFKGFGTIACSSESYIFFLSSFREYVDKEKQKFAGTDISFKLKENEGEHSEKHPYIADDIIFEKEEK